MQHSRKNSSAMGTPMPKRRARLAARAIRLAVAAAAVTLVGATILRASAAVAGAADGPPETVAAVDLQRYAGTWFEVARFPNSFQDQCTGHVTASYTPLGDGRVRVVNRCRTGRGATTEAEGIARPVKGYANARLEVRFAPAWLSFLPMVWGDYWVLALADDYTTAVVGSPDRKYLWLLARTPRVDAPTYERMRAAAAAQGYPVDRLERTAQD